jgi:DNA-binding CsgD family transcriptional regulator/tetratricopeptide (TPR) repeat protein
MRDTTLIGRESSLGVAGDLLDGVGSGRHLVVDGESGIGKTALLRAAADLATERGFAVGWAQAHILEQDFPFALARQVFEPLIGELPTADREALLSGVVAPAARLVWGHAEAPPADVGDLAFASLHGLYWLTARLAERSRLLIVLDDLQWADVASLRWLSYVVRRSEDVPLMIATARTSGVSGADELLINELTGSFEHLRLGPLTQDDVAALTARRFDPAPDPSFVTACHRATGGNPFLIQSVCTELGGDPSVSRLEEFGSRTVARWVLSRMNRASQDAERFARAVAILGDNAPLRLIAELADLDLATASTTADALTRLNLLRNDSGLGFVHAIVRNAVNAQISAGERMISHLRAARVLNDSGGAKEQIAGHLLATDPLGEEWAAHVLWSTGLKALEEGAADIAVTHLRRALREPSGEWLKILTELGRAELRTDLPAAVEHLTRAFELSTDPAQTAVIAELLALACCENSQNEQALGRKGVSGPAGGEVGSELALSVLDRALGLLNGSDDRLRTNLEILALGISSRVVGMPQAAYVRRLRPKAATDVGVARAIAGTIANRLSAAGKSNVEAVREARQVIELGPPPTMRDFYAYHQAGLALCRADELDDAARCAEDLLTQAVATHQPHFAANGHGLRAWIACLAGRLADAVEEAEAAIEIHATITRSTLGQGAEVHLVEALLEQGRLDEAERVLAGLGLLGNGPAPYWSLFCLESRGRYRMLRGDDEGALADFLEAGRRMTEFGVVNPGAVPWRSRAAIVRHRLGDTDAALQLASDELDRAKRWGARRPIGVAMRAVGLITEDVDLLAGSVETLAESPARLEYAYSLYHLGQHPAQGGTEARKLLRSAYGIAHACGAPPLVERIATALNRHGARRPRPPQSGLAGLTAQERRVAELAAAGATNREIAEDLFLTQRTVEAHLTSTYRKLSITGRPQLHTYF